MLDDVVKECLELGLRMFMDLKGDDLGVRWLNSISFYIQGVTGPHRQNDRDDIPGRDGHFL